MAEMWMPGAERLPQPGGVTLNRSLPARATWHITWDKITNGAQPPFENVSGYLQRAGYCPHLMWDPFTGRIVQFYPADVGGRALNAWNEDGEFHVQIEVYFSPGVTRDGVSFQTVADTPANGWDQILAWLDTLGIPRTWPMGAPQWQGNSRDVDIWNTQAGHYGHCNVPQNTHTDPGPMPGLHTEEKDWFDMATSAELRTIVREEVALLFDQGKHLTYKNPKDGPDVWALIAGTHRDAVKLVAEQVTQRAIIDQLAKGQGVVIDYAKLDVAIEKSVRESLAGAISITGTIKAGAK